jgi:DNA-binding beta-propeller fold protein YncE
MDTKKKGAPITIFLTIIAMFVVFSEQRAEWIDEREYKDESGMTHRIAANLRGNNRKIKLEFIGHLGEIDGEDENYLFYKPCDIAGDSEGNLYVLDGGNHRVQKFDSKGKHLTSFGRSGQGPGEFQWPLSIDIDEDGNVYVADWMNCRLEVFSSHGEYLRSIKLMTPVHRIRLLSSGEIAIMNPRVGRENSSYEESTDGSKPFLPLIKIIDESGKVIRKFGEGIIFKIFPLVNGGNRLIFAKDDEDNIYLSLLFQNRIEKFTPEGKLVFQTSRPVPDEMHHRTAKKPNVYILISQGIDVDSLGRIWTITVTRRLKKEEAPPAGLELTETDRYRLDVLDNKGTLLNSFPLTHFCDDMRIIDDKIYILDQKRTMRFYIYKMSKKEN